MAERTTSERSGAEEGGVARGPDVIARRFLVGDGRRGECREAMPLGKGGVDAVANDVLGLRSAFWTPEGDGSGLASGEGVEEPVEGGLGEHVEGGGGLGVAVGDIPAKGGEGCWGEEGGGRVVVEEGVLDNDLVIPVVEAELAEVGHDRVLLALGAARARWTSIVRGTTPVRV